jgi:hypothetical protein
MLRRTAVEGKVLAGGATIDLNVDQTQRLAGPALMLARSVINDSDREGRSILFGMPNASATAVMKRAGYREIGEFSSWTKLLRSEPTLRSKLHSPLAARVVAPLIDQALKWKSHDWRTRLPHHVIAETITRFDRRFDCLWEKASRHFDVLGERSEDYLTWRFTDCPDLRYEIFTLADRTSQELLGYIVWFADEGAVSISDLLAVDDASTALLLAEFTRATRSTGATAIRLGCFASEHFYQQLLAGGFHRRQNRHSVLCRFSCEASDKTRSGANWFLTMADSDTDV